MQSLSHQPVFVPCFKGRLCSDVWLRGFHAHHSRSLAKPPHWSVSSLHPQLLLLSTFVRRSSVLALSPCLRISQRAVLISAFVNRSFSAANRRRAALRLRVLHRDELRLEQLHRRHSGCVHRSRGQGRSQPAHLCLDPWQSECEVSAGCSYSCWKLLILLIARIVLELQFRSFRDFALMADFCVLSNRSEQRGVLPAILIADESSPRKFYIRDNYYW